MTPPSVRAQIVIGALVIMSVIASLAAYSARQTYLEQVRILGQQMPIVARVLADALVPGEDAPEKIRRVLEGLQVTPDSAALIEDGEGRVVASMGPAVVIANRSLATMPRLSTSRDADGVERVWGTERRVDGRSIVAVARPTRIAWERSRPIYQRNLFVVVVAVVLVVGVLSLLVAWSTRGIRRLEAMATRVSSGDLSAPTTTRMPSRELHFLQSTMVEMVTRVRELQGQIVRQERLAAIGTLVSGVAHEISNPLQSILGSSQVMQTHADLPLELRADLTVIQNESMRASTIIRNLSRFTRQQPSGPAPVQLQEVVQWLTELWRRRLEEQSITLEVDDQSVGTTLVVATELQQVALNFLVNAEYAVLHGGGTARRVVVRTRDTAVGRLRFEVEDSGPGVPADVEGKLFQPFFTTKPVGDGTGLGLSVSYGIIHSYGGTIGHERGVTDGALFYFELPAQER